MPQPGENPYTEARFGLGKARNSTTLQIKKGRPF